MAELPDVTGPSEAVPARVTGPVGPPAALAPVIAASTHWLARAYPADDDGVVSATLVELQARQAVTVAAWLRYPSTIDAELVAITGPGGSGVLDWRVGTEPDEDDDDGWRSWVDEVVVSWAAALLTDPTLAARAVSAVLTPAPASAASAVSSADADVAAPGGSGMGESGLTPSGASTGGTATAFIPAPRPRPHPQRAGGAPSGFRRLVAPDARDRAAATLLRHPDLLAAVADPHREALLAALPADPPTA